MSAHTPGPWKWNLSSVPTIDIRDANGNYVCEVSAMNYSENKENARLIAAAPEMFELLKCVNAEREYYAINELIQKIEGEV